MSLHPTVTCLSAEMTSLHVQRYRLRLVGGDIAEDWRRALRPGRDAVCEITVYSGETQLASYSGEVWPAAWPDLFRVSTPNAQTGSTTSLTKEGALLVAAAVARFDDAIDATDYDDTIRTLRHEREG